MIILLDKTTQMKYTINSKKLKLKKYHTIGRVLKSNRKSYKIEVIYRIIQTFTTNQELDRVIRKNIFIMPHAWHNSWYTNSDRQSRWLKIRWQAHWGTYKHCRRIGKWGYIVSILWNGRSASFWRKWTNRQSCQVIIIINVIWLRAHALILHFDQWLWLLFQYLINF